MRPAASLLQLAVCLSSLAPLTSAWPGWFPEADSVIVRRVPADNTDSASATPTGKDKPKETNSKSKSTESSSTKKDGNSHNTAMLNTADPSATGKPKSSDNDKNSTHTTYAINDPAGGVTMLTPNTMLQPTPLYKIGDHVTLAWNYTSLQGTPTAIDVIVSCSANAGTWTLTSNMSFATNVNYVWDTTKEEKNVETPLLTNLFTLIIKDAQAAITDVPQPGYLGTYSGFRFGLYQKQPYENLSDWTCPGVCSAAAPNVDRSAVGLAVTMSVVSLLSFTWFVAGLGLQ